MRCFTSRLASLLMLVAGNAAVVYGCPFCSENLNQNSTGVARGYYWSILFMLAVVFVVFATIAITIVRAQRAAKTHGSNSRES